MRWSRKCLHVFVFPPPPPPLSLCSDTKLEVQRQRLSSVVAADLIPSLEGMELGAYGKVGPPHGGGARESGLWLSLSFGYII